MRTFIFCVFLPCYTTQCVKLREVAVDTAFAETIILTIRLDQNKHDEEYRIVAPVAIANDLETTQ